MESSYPRLDPTTTGSWVYPTNYPLRQYQLDIAKQALFTNTLVCLPTGLGKTLIAAVIMYNYYRWFPEGKIIFMAPTRPLVAQQRSACVDILQIPESHTVTLEGTIAADKRTAQYDKRVIFCTPQTLLNDLRAGKLAISAITCVVFDEAHRATSNYAYTQIMLELQEVSQHFRVLALSATPGSDTKKIQSVITNLHISHVEIRTEDDPDIQPYVYNKDIEVVKCKQLSSTNLTAFLRGQVNATLQEIVDRLHAASVLMDRDLAYISKPVIDETQKLWAEILAEADAEEGAALQRQLEAVQLLLRIKRALIQDDDIAACCALLQGPLAQAAKSGDPVLCASLDSLRSIFDKAQRDPSYLLKRMPKIDTLKEILTEQLSDGTAVRRILVFVQLRATVHEILHEIAALPHVRAREFVGQRASTSGTGVVAPGGGGSGSGQRVQRTLTGDKLQPSSAPGSAGLTQAEQIEILDKFNKNIYNILVATSIAEEGLDISEVDMIILFDSVYSPIRYIQRCGRTGRHKLGKVVIISHNSSSSGPALLSSLYGNPTDAEEEKLLNNTETITKLNKLLKQSMYNMKLHPPGEDMFQGLPALPEVEFREMAPASATIGATAVAEEVSRRTPGTLPEYFSGPASQRSSLFRRANPLEIIDLLEDEEGVEGEGAEGLGGPDEDPFAFVVVDTSSPSRSRPSPLAPSVLSVSGPPVVPSPALAPLGSVRFSPQRYELMLDAASEGAEEDPANGQGLRSPAPEQPQPPPQPCSILNSSVPSPTPIAAGAQAVVNKTFVKTATTKDGSSVNKVFFQSAVRLTATATKAIASDFTTTFTAAPAAAIAQPAVIKSAVAAAPVGSKRPIVTRTTVRGNTKVNCPASTLSAVSSLFATTGDINPTYAAPGPTVSSDAPTHLSNLSIAASITTAPFTALTAPTTASIAPPIVEPPGGATGNILSAMSRAASLARPSTENLLELDAFSFAYDVGTGFTQGDNPIEEICPVALAADHELLFSAVHTEEALPQPAPVALKGALEAKKGLFRSLKVITSSAKEGSPGSKSTAPTPRLAGFKSIVSVRSSSASAGASSFAPDDDFIAVGTEWSAWAPALKPCPVPAPASSPYHDSGLEAVPGAALICVPLGTPPVPTSPEVSFSQFKYQPSPAPSLPPPAAPLWEEDSPDVVRPPKPRPPPSSSKASERRKYAYQLAIEAWGAEGQRCAVCLDQYVSASASPPKVIDMTLDSSDSDSGGGSVSEEWEGWLRCRECLEVCHADCYGVGDEVAALTQRRKSEPHQSIVQLTFLCEGCSYRRTAPQSGYCMLCRQPRGLLKEIAASAANEEFIAFSAPYAPSSSSSEATGAGAEGSRHFTHQLCSLFTPELILDDDMRSSNLRALDPERAVLLCRGCRGRGGAVVQCHHQQCLAAYHPQCARSGGVYLCIHDGRKGGIEYHLYCAEHEHESRRAKAPLLSSSRPLTTSALIRPDGAAMPVAAVAAAAAAAVTKPSIRFNDAPERHKGPAEISRPIDGSPEEDDLFQPTQPAMEVARRRKRLRREGQVDGGGVVHAKGQERRSRGKEVQHLFDSDVDVSGSDSGDEAADSDEELSGDFINDGAYTQASPLPGPAKELSEGSGPGPGHAHDTPTSFYLAVNRHQSEIFSQDDSDVDLYGLVNGKNKKRKAHVFVDTPERSEGEENSPDPWEHRAAPGPVSALGRPSTASRPPLHPIAPSRPALYRPPSQAPAGRAAAVGRGANRPFQALLRTHANSGKRAGGDEFLGEDEWIL